MATICRQMGTAYNAGIPILRALTLVAEQGASTQGKRFLDAMAASIKQGATLAEAARAESRVVPDLFVEVVSAGETGGRLDVLLRDLADHYDSIHRMKNTLIVSLIYPGLQLASAWFLGTFALGIVRSLGNLYSGSGERFSMRTYLTSYLSFQLVAMITLFFFVTAMVVLTRVGLLESPLALLKNHIWPLSHISRKLALARFYRAMALLIQAGVDIKQCIRRAAAMTLNPTMERDLLQAIPVVAAGGTLVEGFSKSRCLERIGREMIGVGEQTGNLDSAFLKAAEYSFGEAQTAISSAVKVLRVLITLIVGAIVGYVVISFYSNLYGSALNAF